MENRIAYLIQQSIAVKQAVADSPALLLGVETAVNLCVDTFQRGGKVLFCGNGGSAADAQHLAAEFSGRFYTDRPPLYAEALHVNTSYLTAVANDYDFETVYSRMVQAAGRPGDVLFALSTSGNSPNVLRAIEAAHAAQMAVVALTGASGGRMAAARCTVLLNVPSTDTPRIQEAHMLLGHIICGLVEATLFPQHP